MGTVVLGRKVHGLKVLALQTIRIYSLAVLGILAFVLGQTETDMDQ